MATKPRDLLVRFLADVAPFLRSTDQVEDAYRDMADDSDRLADLGEKDARRLASAYDRAADEMKRDARETGKVTKQGFADAGKESGQEFVSNLGESVSSGDVSGLLSGTAGGLVSTFGAAGPIGIALAGLGTAASLVFAGMGAAAEKAREAAQTAFDELIDGASQEAKLRNRLEELFGTYEEGMTAIARQSEATGIPIAKIAEALAEGGEPARELAEQTDKIAQHLLIGARSRGSGITQNELDRAKQLADSLRTAATATERAAKAEQTRGQALRISAASYATAYGAGGSVYRGQVPTYQSGKRGW